ncbi:MAG: transporter substrate-binding domain-containing protein [Pseudomonadota bacterium]
MRAIIIASWIVLSAGVGAAITAGPAKADVLQRIVETGEIRLGVRADAPPFSYLDPERGYRGLAVDICVEVAARMALTLETTLKPVFVEQSAKSRFPALINGETDLHCGPATATLARRDMVDFSILYFVDGVSLAGLPGAYDALFERGGGRIGVLEGTTAVAIIEDLIERNDLAAEVIPYPSHAAGLEALDREEVQLYAGDQAILLFMLSATFPEAPYYVQDEVLSFEPYALVMRRGASDLRLAVDRALSAIITDGVIYTLIRRSFGDFPLPPEALAAYEIVALPE